MGFRKVDSEGSFHGQALFDPRRHHWLRAGKARLRAYRTAIYVQTLEKSAFGLDTRSVKILACCSRGIGEKCRLLILQK